MPGENTSTYQIKQGVAAVPGEIPAIVVVSYTRTGYFANEFEGDKNMAKDIIAAMA
ncbi:hypothetical protein [Serratia liquefaciens]|uniref:hypothetical protein n=1 Tax=Serratia liquefaciens TaxID=614 RepID=UPI00159FF9CB|nr:hypothetical protein [Serratia liquefaciens]NWA21556.1 hypothetical protein [Serratia liquefaciens]HDS5480183.1 hypothetical protein [Serratia liquefaciens]HEJ7948997.1 hypothetical protein [Serratia liquefaciens]HEJ7990815.1 hypothetical protein [Serratia liquefaciens]